MWNLTFHRLSKTRRKRPIPEGWATSEVISAYKPVDSTDPLYSAGKTLSVNSSGDSALVETAEGIVSVFSLSQKQVVHNLQASGPVTDAIWAGDKVVIASSTGSVKVFENGKETASFGLHAGAATALTLHATGDIFASVGVDKSYVLYDLTTNSVIVQNFSDACKPNCNFRVIGGPANFSSPTQPSFPCNSTQTVTSLQLVAQMGRLRFMTLKPEPQLQTMTLLALSRAFSSPRMVHSWLQ